MVPAGNVEIQLCRTDLRIHGEGSNVHKNAGAAFLDLHEFLGLEITQDDSHLLQWHFGIFGNKTQRVESSGLQQVNLIVLASASGSACQKERDCGRIPVVLQVNHFEGIQEGIVCFDSLFVEAHRQFFSPRCW